MKWILCLLLVFSSHISLALDLQTLIDGYPCKSQIDSLFKRLKVIPYKWEPRMDLTEGRDYYVAQTKDIGYWVVFKNNSDGIWVMQETEKVIVKHQFQEKTCEKKISFELKDHKIKNTKSYFTDKNLRDIVKTKKTGIVLYWSSNMAVSIYSIPVLVSIANELSLDLHITHEVGLDINMIKKIIKSHGLKQKVTSKPLRSFHLSMMGIEKHFPSLIVFSRGRITSPVLVGLKDRKKYIEFINLYK